MTIEEERARAEHLAKLAGISTTTWKGAGAELARLQREAEDLEQRRAAERFKVAFEAYKELLPQARGAEADSQAALSELASHAGKQHSARLIAFRGSPQGFEWQLQQRDSHFAHGAVVAVALPPGFTATQVELAQEFARCEAAYPHIAGKAAGLAAQLGALEQEFPALVDLRNG